MRLKHIMNHPNPQFYQSETAWRRKKNYENGCSK